MRPLIGAHPLGSIMLFFGTCKIRFVLVEIKKLLSVAMSRPAPGASNTGSMFYSMAVS
jgi:hypothetical protein